MKTERSSLTRTFDSPWTEAESSKWLKLMTDLFDVHRAVHRNII